MKEIGGYFELELPESKHNCIHSDSVLVNSGRHALEYILRALGGRVKKVKLPYFTCEVVLKPIISLGLPYEFYNINSNFEIDGEVDLQEGEYIIANNYFGIKDEYISELSKKLGNKLIVDNAQAWYAKKLSAGSGFYSPRKFFGLPDGGMLYCEYKLKENLVHGISSDRCSHLLKRIDEGAESGYLSFRNNSDTLADESLKQMSRLTYKLLTSIDQERVRVKRRMNFRYLHKMIGCQNMIRLSEIDTFECPMVYPFLTNDASLRERLIKNKIYVATYWPNVFEWCKSSTQEFIFAKYLLPLPIDQRYGISEMKKIIKTVNR